MLNRFLSVTGSDSVTHNHLGLEYTTQHQVSITHSIVIVSGTQHTRQVSVTQHQVSISLVRSASHSIRSASHTASSWSRVHNTPVRSASHTASSWSGIHNTHTSVQRHTKHHLGIQNTSGQHHTTSSQSRVHNTHISSPSSTESSWSSIHSLCQVSVTSIRLTMR